MDANRQARLLLAMAAIVIVGRNVARLRAAKGMSQSQLAKKLGAQKLGVSQGYISELEAGGRNPTLSTLEALANALGVALVDLLADQPEG